jgi:hypothetical protein
MAREMTRPICGGWAASFAVAAAALMLAAAALGPTRAHAAVPHVYSFAITGSGTNALWAPAAVAVDNSAGPSAQSLYVTDDGESRVVKFGPAGNFILMFGDGVNATTGGDVCTASSGNVCGAGNEASPSGVPAGAFRAPEYIAVDSSAGPSAGHVYVGDTGTETVSKFDSSGTPIQGWGSGGQLEIAGVGLLGIAVRPGGNLVVVGYRFEQDQSEIFEYSPGGALLSQVVTDSEGAFGAAVDSAGNLYRAVDYSVAKVAPGGAELGSFPTDGHPSGLAVDPFDDDLYVNVSEQGVRRYAAGCSLPCTPVATFGQGHLGYGFRDGIAVDASDHVVYAVAEGRRGVGVFVPPGVVPEATTGSSSVASQKVIRVDGSVDPAGAGSVTGCRFEYVDQNTYYNTHFLQARSVPCVPPPPFNGPRQVSAYLTDLDGGANYFYRLMASNSNGPRTGLAQTFRTGTMTESVTGPAEVHDRRSATLSGRVLPGGSATVTVCFFEYVEHRYLLSSGFQSARWVPCTPAPPYTSEAHVSVYVSGLSPGTTYHYRLSAWDAAGIGNGVEQSFTTAPDALGPGEPTEPETDSERERGRGRHPGKVHCQTKACSRTFRASVQLRKWISPRFPPNYGWLFSVYKDGKSLAHTRPAGGCISTFTGRGMIATLNGCQGRFKLTYIGNGEFSIRWRVFRHCRCGDASRRAPRRAAHTFR